MKDVTNLGHEMTSVLAAIQKATGAFMFAKGIEVVEPKFPEVRFTIKEPVEVVLERDEEDEPIKTKTEMQPVNCLELKHLSYAGQAVADIFSTIDQFNTVKYPSTDIIVRNNVLSEYTIPAEFVCFMRPAKVVLLSEFADDDRADDILMQYKVINDSKVGEVLPPDELNLAFDVLLKAINPKCQACYGLSEAKREVLHLTKEMIETYPTYMDDGETLVHRQTEDICNWVLSYRALRRRQYSIDSALNYDVKLLNWARKLKILSTKRVVDNAD
jgi:hypothetical protein